MPIYNRIVPSSFSSTIWSWETLSYRVCGGFTADGMAEVVQMESIGRMNYKEGMRCIKKKRVEEI